MQVVTTCKADLVTSLGARVDARHSLFTSEVDER